MFTQCPDCQTTFRVTAKVLQQAAGRVRCGGCGNAFNALDHLSEDDAHAEQDAIAARPVDDTNKELLAALDKLAGPDVRIEDTGVEWRVVEEGDAISRQPGDEPDTGESGSMRFVLEDEAPARAELHGRHDDLPQPVADSQEPLDLPGRERASIDPNEMRFDDNTGLPDDFGDEQEDEKLPYPSGPVEPKRRASDRDAAADTSAFDEAQVDLALGHPDDWVELLDEVNHEEDTAGIAEAAADDERVAELQADAAGVEPPEAEMPCDIDTQFLLQAEDMGIDTGSHEIAATAEAKESDARQAGDEVIAAPGQETGEEPETETDEAEETGADEELQLELESTGEFEEQIAVAARALRGQDSYETEPGDGDEEAAVELEEFASLDVEKELEEPKAERQDTDTSSTIVGGNDVSQLFKEDSPMVETIIMEGDSVRDALEEKEQTSGRSTGEIETPGPLIDTYALNRGKSNASKRPGPPPGMTVMVSVAALALLLLGQVVHQSRETLATYGAFNHTIGSIYRVLGKAVTPDWDIKGWRFEVTNGSIDDDKDLLTIYSRIGNNSGQSLPYPLVHVSLTDRWEEIIGSRVLEPGEYLPDELDPSRPVPPGENFTAAITIESPSADAAGFKLNVCYRVAQGRMRCAIEAFKD